MFYFNSTFLGQNSLFSQNQIIDITTLMALLMSCEKGGFGRFDQYEPASLSMNFITVKFK